MSKSMMKRLEVQKTGQLSVRENLLREAIIVAATTAAAKMGPEGFAQAFCKTGTQFTAKAARRELRRDAERYRWLRQADDCPLLREASDLLTGDKLDAAIDAAIAKERERHPFLPDWDDHP